MKRLFILLIGVISSINGFSQTVLNVVARAEGEQVQINYDLQGNPGESYEVRISCSRDGGKSFTVTPAKVSGAVNRWEAPGTTKTIVWEAKKDLGEFEGDLQFKITATGKAGTTAIVQKSSTSPSSTSGSGSLTAETDNLTLTITDVFTVPDGFKIMFRIKAKAEIEVGFATGTTAEDHFGNVYTITASDIESLGVLQGKTRKFVANARKDGEMILKISKMNSPSLSGRILKNLTIESTVGTIQLTDIPRL
jgi:hypothetical protein